MYKYVADGKLLSMIHIKLRIINLTRCSGTGKSSSTAKGFNLPVTGGFGTLLFSGIGVLLVLAGVAVLFSMKKKNKRA